MSRGRGEGVGNPLDTNANQYGQTISQIGRQAGWQAGRLAAGQAGGQWACQSVREAASSA